jgi:hypothetical protein
MIPKKSKDLHIISHIGSIYATFDGSVIWRLDKLAYKILTLCNGKNTVGDIVEKISKETGMSKEKVKHAVINILNELKELKFVKFEEACETKGG